MIKLTKIYKTFYYIISNTKNKETLPKFLSIKLNLYGDSRGNFYSLTALHSNQADMLFVGTVNDNSVYLHIKGNKYNNPTQWKYKF